MTQVDLEKLRVALRQMSRGHLLMIAERAIQIATEAQLLELVGDMVRLPLLSDDQREAPSLVGEVRKFHDAALRGDYYESFDANYKNCTDKSKGTEAFIAEFDRLMAKCLRAAAEGSHIVAREALELLLALLRRIDEDPDSIVFFADEAGSWQVPVDWRVVLPVYFRCIAEGTSAEEFARAVDRAISDFAHSQRPDHLAAARSVANLEQWAALEQLRTRTGCR